MKVSAAAAALLSLAVPTATAWTAAPRLNSAASTVHRSSSISIRSPSLLQSTTVKDAAVDEVSAAEAVPPSTDDEVFGTVPASNLNKLYDLVVIGGGPAGVAGAIKAAQMGRRAILIDKPKFDAGVLPNGLDLFFGGPTGLFSKALRDSAKNTNVAAMRAQDMDSDV